MNKQETLKIIDELSYKPSLTQQEEYIYIEALQYLISNTNDSVYLTMLGGYYYEKKEYELSLKYIAKAADQGDLDACNTLGYIYYYGRVGKPNYELAYKYYSKASISNNEAKYKIADMYKNGYYVEKDYKKYCKIIEEIYEEVKDSDKLFDVLPEICMRLGHIKEKDNPIEALELYFKARNFFVQRLNYNTFFGTYSNIKWAVNSMYNIIEFDELDFDIFDLYYLFKEEHKVSFKYQRKDYYIEAIKNNNMINIKFNDQWYRDIDEFMIKAKLNNHILTNIYERLYCFILEE